METSINTPCMNCKSTDIFTDPARGSIYCGECGMVQEENTIVSTLQFDSSGVKSTLHGQMINIDNTNIGTKFVDSSFYIRNTISSICIKLSLGNDHVECAFRWYKLCLQYSISKGKSILYTLSACVYITCRQEGTPHLLIDFSNELRIDMFKIGKVFLRLRMLLGIDIPLIDPSLYMHRFVSQLKFENKEILSFSIRLVSRMKKDWILTGRRPNNSCGAALLIASRVFVEERSIAEIAKVVHASKSTITKRLKEIARTESANLGIAEFNYMWLEEENNPPVVLKRDCIDKGCIDRKYIDKGYIDKGYMKENIINKDYTNKDYTNKDYTNKDYTNKDYTNKDYTNKDNILHEDQIITQIIACSKEEAINYIYDTPNLEESTSADNKYDIKYDCDDDSSFNYNEMILSEEEIKSKALLWDSLYGDFIIERESKKKDKTKAITPHKRKKYNFETVEEAFLSLDKKVSSKLNYAAIEGLFNNSL